MFDVISCGSATIDVFGHTNDSEVIKIKDSHGEEDFIAYRSGAKILIKKLEFSTGGGGTNTAASMSLLGLNVAYLGNLGNDENGDMVIRALKQYKIKFIGTRSNHMTNYSYVLESLEGDRTILAYKEASSYLNFDKINKAQLKTRWFYFSSLMGPSFEAMKKLVAFAKEKGIMVAFNASNYQAQQGKAVLAPVLSKTDLLILNKEEAELMTGLKGASIETLLKDLHAAGPVIVAVTKGKEGIDVLYEGRIYSAKPPKTKVLQTTGAGDAFASSLLAGLVKKRGDIEFAIKLGLTNASSCIEKVGAKNGLLSYKEALQRMKKHPVRIVKRVLK